MQDYFNALANLVIFPETALSLANNYVFYGSCRHAFGFQLVSCRALKEAVSRCETGSFRARKRLFRSVK